MSTTRFEEARGVVVTDFGGVGDGRHDNAPAFRDALAALAGCRYGTVHVPDGVFATSEPVSIPQGWSLNLAPSAIIRAHDRFEGRALAIVVIACVAATRSAGAEPASTPPTASASAPAEMPPAITDAAGGEHVWYGNLNVQHGMYHDGKTFFTFHGGGGDDTYIDPMVMAYDHEADQVLGPVKVGENPLARYPDFHGNPGMIVDDLGHIHVIYGGHGHHRGQMRHAVSVRPGDISEWEHLDNIDPLTTYPALFKLEDGTLIYLYRAGNHRDDWVYVRSTDHGRTWSEPQALLSSGTPRDDGRYFEQRYWDGWYGKGIHGTGNTLHYVTRYHACANDYGQQYHIERRVNLYYLFMDESGTWRNIAGEPLDIPLDLVAAEREARIFESEPPVGQGETRSVVLGNLAVDRDNRPYILFRTGTGRWGTEQQELWLAKGDPEAGRFEFLSVPTGGVLRVVSPQELEITNAGGIWRSHDGGRTWIEPTEPLHPAGTGAVVRLHDPHPDAQLLMTEPRPDEDLRRIKLYLWGERGFIGPQGLEP